MAASGGRHGDGGVQDEIRQLELTLEKTESRVRFLEDENTSLREVRPIALYRFSFTIYWMEL